MDIAIAPSLHVLDQNGLPQYAPSCLRWWCRPPTTPRIHCKLGWSAVSANHGHLSSKAALLIQIPPALARSTLDAAPDAMLIIDTLGTIWFANRQVSALFGYAPDEVIGESIEKLVPERFRDQHPGHRERYVNNLRIRPMGVGLELFGHRRDATEFPIEISLTPIEDVGRTLIAAAIRDVTDRKRIEAELSVARDAADDLRQALQALALLNGNLRRILSSPDAAELLSRQDEAIAAMSRLLDVLAAAHADGTPQSSPSGFSDDRRL
jgi:PAS domain S-box-containing protein